MSEYYRTVFSATKSGLSGVPLLESVQDAIQEWVRGDFGPGEPSSDSPGARTGGAGELSEIERRLDGESLATFRIKWERPDPDDEIGRWRMSVRLATEGADVEVDIEIQGSENRLLGFRDECVAKLPSVPHGLLGEFDCALDGRRLAPKAERIEGGGESASFIDSRLFGSERRIPLVVVSHDRDGNSVDADGLQKNLLGLATVVSYDHRAAWDIARDIPRALRCYDGAVRLYSPGCARTDVAQRNPYWLLSDALSLEKSGDLWLILRDECVNRIPRHTRRRLYARVRRRIQEAERAEEIQALSDMEGQISERERLVSERASLIRDAYRALDDRDAPDNPAHLPLYRRWARAFKNQNAMLKSENASLKSEVERLKDIVEAGEQDGFAPTVVPSAAPRDFKTVWEAVAEANKSLDSLRFFPTAFEYARDSQFRPASKVYEAFAVLNDCAKARAKGGLGKDLAQWLAERGVEYARRESGATDENEAFRRARTFCGVYMRAHVKMGGGDLRIHLRWEEAEGKWLIGYVGKHLPTANFPD